MSKQNKNYFRWTIHRYCNDELDCRVYVNTLREAQREKGLTVHTLALVPVTNLINNGFVVYATIGGVMQATVQREELIAYLTDRGWRF